ncbi:MAG: hypothetical protein AAFO89_12210, partial [Planctomycetota bacterium]
MRSRSDEMSELRKAEAIIMRKASTATNFNQTAGGSFSIGLANISATTQFGLNQEQESANNKKDFREATIRAAEEYRREHELTVESQSSEEFEESNSGEISNPNNELTVTYLFYELQRRYNVREHLHRVRPVIMVAQDVPTPDEIDDAWLLRHEWILRRVILDDTLLLALDDLSDSFTGDELGVEILEASWHAQLDAVRKLEGETDDLMRTRDELRDALISATLREGLADADRSSTEEDIAAAIFSGGWSLFGSGDDDRKIKEMEAHRKAAETRVDHVVQQLAEAQSKLRAANAGLREASRAYTEAVQRRTNRRTAIDQLRMHVKQNILYYMQAIWDHESPDQRFFRLYDVKVRCPKPDRPCVVQPDDDAFPFGKRLFPGNNGLGFTPLCVPSLSDDEVDLVQIADLDSPLGYKGNYIIFPLKERCYLTDFMMSEFVDDYFGLRDPDEFGNYTIEELGKYIECVWHRDETTDADRERLRDLYLRRLSEPRRDFDEIIVP